MTAPRAVDGALGTEVRLTILLTPRPLDAYPTGGLWNVCTAIAVFTWALTSDRNPASLTYEMSRNVAVLNGDESQRFPLVLRTKEVLGRPLGGVRRGDSHCASPSVCHGPSSTRVVAARPTAGASGAEGPPPKACFSLWNFALLLLTLPSRGSGG